MVEFKGGRLPNDPSKPRLKLKNILRGAAFQFPTSCDYVSKVADWPMYLNDRYGDCTCATAGHIIEAVTTYGQGSTIKISDADVLRAYEAVSGFNPSTGANDNGAVVQDVLNYWRKTGIGGHKILAFAEVDVKNYDELYAALALFGTLYLGIDFPNTAMDQFDKGQPWDVVEGARSEGGHAINAGFYDSKDGLWKVITWGKVQPMTQAFWDKYVEEAWIVISPEWLNANGTNSAGISAHELNEQFRELTGQPGPFPEAEPTPEPGPSPVNPSPTPEPPAPTPTPVDPDSLFEAQARKWLARRPFFYRCFQRHLRTWLATRA